MQRNGVYSERKRVLERSRLRDWIIEYAERSLCDLAMLIDEKSNTKERSLLSFKLQELLGIPFSISLENFDVKTNTQFLQQQFHISYNLKEIEMEAIEPNLLSELERSFLLQNIDFS